MKFQRFILSMLLFSILLFLPNIGTAQMEDDWGCEELVDPSSSGEATQRGGRYFTANGVIRALVVFVQFKDDTTNPNSSVWPLNQAPVFLDDVLDQSLGQPLNNGGFSHWLREMSFSQLQMYGDAYHVITDQTKNWYASNGKDYGDVNKDMLVKLDSAINFADYDNWDFGTNYTDHVNRPDGQVDWIIMIHREDLAASMHPGHAIAALGNNDSNFTVENSSITIVRDWPGSGCSFEQGSIRGLDTSGYAHELGHLLFGAGHPGYHKDPGGVFNQAYWGLLFHRSIMLNAYDRERLGWIDFNEITDDSLTIVVSDFITTGDAYRIPIPGTTNEAFVIENHQELYYFDQPSLTGSAKGLYIMHISGTGHLPKHDIECAEGGFDWTNPFWMPNPWGSNNIPVFEKGSQNRNGRDALDALPTVSPTGWHKDYVEYFEGDTLKNRRVLGSKLDPFKINYNQVFSPWSNPTSHRWDGTTTTGITIEVLNESNGNYTVKVWTNGKGYNAAPSKPQNLTATESCYNCEVELQWEPNTEPDMINGGKYRIYRSEVWGTGDPASFSLVATIDAYNGSTPVTSWIDNESVTYSGVKWLHYYITALDNTQKESTPSNTDKINGRIPKLAADKDQVVTEFSLSQNYPNPFNPTTTITFALPNDSPVRLTVFDSNGRQVAELVNKQLSAGSYEIPFEASALSSGVYFYRFTAGNFHQTNKMMLLK